MDSTTHEKIVSVPYFVYEGEQTRNERHIRRLVIALVVTILLLFASNALWIWYMSGFDIETYDYTQDGMGVNISDRRYSGRYSGERRDSMGRYSRDNSELVHKLRELMYSAPDDRTRQEFQSFVSRIESMA